MKTPRLDARPLCSRAIAYASALCLLLSPLAPAAAAQIKKKAKPAPARIEISQKDSNAVLTVGSGVVFVAKVFSKSGELLEGGEVKWVVSGSDAVTVGQFIDSGATHEATLIGFKPSGRSVSSASVNLTASVANGAVSSTKNDIPFRAKLNVVVDSPRNKLAAGERFTPKITVRDGDTELPEIPASEVKWSYSNQGDREFLLLSRDSQDMFSVVGLKPPEGKMPPANVVILANYGGIPTPVSIPYGEGGATGGGHTPKVTATVSEILVSANGVPPDPCASPTPTPASPFAAKEEPDYEIEPGRRLALWARLKVEDCKDKDLPKLVWKVPKEMSKHIAILEQQDGRAVFYGLTPESEDDEEVRESLYVLVQAVDEAGEGKAKKDDKERDLIKFAKAVPIVNGEQTVDVSWNILPTEVVTKNYGRNVSDKFYAIEVVVGNNSGNDLQLTGLSFEIDKKLLPADSNIAALRRVPVSSYDVVRGMTEQRKLSFKSRGTIIAGLDTAAQILTGFTPFFNVATRARNFSQGINILGNPVTKGIERLWPDPVQDELNRLEEQSLHDDKIIPNNSVFRTTVFFPRNVLTRAGSGTTEDLMDVRRKLGQLILVGSKLNRNDFHLRVRQGQRQQARGSGQ